MEIQSIPRDSGDHGPRLKIKQELVAQTEAFAESLTNIEDYHAIMSHIDVIAGIRDFESVDIDLEIKPLIKKYKDEYVDFFRTRNRSEGRSEWRQEKQQILAYREAYREYEQEVIRIKAKLEEIVAHRKGQGLDCSDEAIIQDARASLDIIGFGTRSVGIRISNKQPSVVLKLPIPVGVGNELEKIFIRQLNLHQQIAAMKRMVDVPHATHLIGYSSRDLAIIVPEVKGRSLGDGPINHRDQLTDEQLGQIVDVLVAAAEREIAIDNNPFNIFIDDAGEIHFIDYDFFDQHAVNYTLGNKNRGNKGAVIDEREKEFNPYIFFQQLKVAYYVSVYNHGGLNINPDIRRGIPHEWKDFIGLDPRQIAISLRRPIDETNSELLFEEGREKLLSALRMRHPIHYAMINKMMQELSERNEKAIIAGLKKKWIDDNVVNDQELMATYDSITARVDGGEITEDVADELYAVAGEVAQVRWGEEYTRKSEHTE